MIMKNKIKTAVLAFSFLACGCTGFLEQEPLGEGYGEQVWGSAQGVRQLLSGGYSRFRKTLLNDNPFYVYGDLPSDMVLKANAWNWVTIQEGRWNDGYTAYLDFTTQWPAFYQVITTANTLLNHINDIPASDFNKNVEEGEKEKKQIAAEAHFLYAYANFWLTRIWGDVPLVSESFENADQAFEDGSTINRKQSSSVVVLEYTLKRLDAAILNMEFNIPGDENWGVRADKGAALALKGHVTAWLAHLYTDETRKNAMLQVADDCLAEVIANGNRSLADYTDPNEVLQMFEGKGPEAIFELNVSVVQNESFWLNNGGRQIHCKTYWRPEFQDQVNVETLVVPDAVWSTTLYDKKDIRRAIFFENFGNTNKDDKQPPLLLKYSTGLSKDPNDAKRYFANSNVALMRLTDIYLLRAEVLCKQKRYGQARNLLNIFRKRAQTGDFTGSDDKLLVAIFEERARELVGEGHSAFDRIRNDYWEGCTYMSADRKAKKGYYWPIDLESLLSSNRELVQVPYWQGKI